MPTRSGPSRLDESANTTTAAMYSMQLPLVLDWSGRTTTWFSANAMRPPRRSNGSNAGKGSSVAKEPREGERGQAQGNAIDLLGSVANLQGSLGVL